MLTTSKSVRSHATRRKRFLLLALSLLLSLGFGEIALRVLWHNPYRSELPDHVIKLQIHHPLTDFRIDRALIDPDDPIVRLRTDSRSYVLPSFQHEHPDYTVAFFGGSTTECAAVQESQRFPALVSDILAERGLKVNTLNVGRSGNTAHDSVNNLLLHVVQDRPDMAVLLHAVNDVGLLARDGNYWSRVGHPVNWKDQGRWVFQQASSVLYSAGLARYVLTHKGLQVEDSSSMEEKNRPTHAGLPEDAFRSRVNAFVHLCRDFGIRPILVTQPMSASRNAMTPEWSDMGNQDRFNAIVRDVGVQEGVPVIDLVSFLQEEVEGWKEPMNVFYDGIHVTDKGSRLLAEYITDTLYPQILEHSTADQPAR